MVFWSGSDREPAADPFDTAKIYFKRSPLLRIFSDSGVSNLKKSTMLLSNACVYGLRASLYLASVQNGSYISITQISEKLDISRHFLTKILQQLTQADLMESLKGPNGGVRLKRPGDDISLLEIVAAIDGTDLLTECALGLPGCGSEKPCPLHEQWADTRDRIRAMLEETSLVDLAHKGKVENLRLSPEGKFDWVLS